MLKYCSRTSCCRCPASSKWISVIRQRYFPVFRCVVDILQQAANHVAAINACIIFPFSYVKKKMSLVQSWEAFQCNSWQSIWFLLPAFPIDQLKYVGLYAMLADSYKSKCAVCVLACVFGRCRSYSTIFSPVSLFLASWFTRRLSGWLPSRFARGFFR
jgi:hypothetical protein